MATWEPIICALPAATMGATVLTMPTAPAAHPAHATAIANP